MTPPSPTSVFSTSSSSKQSKHVPLLSLAPPALALGEKLATSEEYKVGEIWNVISRAADIVKDGERLENLAWRHWGQPTRPRRTSISSIATSSTTDLCTPTSEHAPSLCRNGSFERRSFGGCLKLLMEEDNFKDWVGDAKKRIPVPTISVPDTPVASLEIRLVEPTPVPSRVGSLGAGVSVGGLMAAGASVPPMLDEEEEEIIDVPAPQTARLGIGRPRSRSPKKKNKFFIHSSPKEKSGSDTSVPIPSPLEEPLELVDQARPSSGESSGGIIMTKKKKELAEPTRRVSASTMRGKFTGEKRRAAEALAAKKAAEASEAEDGAWEDEGDEEEEEDWNDEDAPEPPAKPEKVQRRSSSKSHSTKSNSNVDLAQLVRKISPNPKQIPPTPAPTPIRKMSKKERMAAAAERAKIDAELEAQRQREMFAKRQIFGDRSTDRPAEGLLTGMFKRGGSMVDLSAVPPAIRRNPTSANITSLGRSPNPNFLRSKSAVAIPVQTGVSVTAATMKPPKRGSDERRPPAGIVLESSGEESEDDSYLASSLTQRKIAELAARRDARTQTQPVPRPMDSGVVMDDNGVVQPLSPTTRRRTIIMREMSESLRRNIILERNMTSIRANPSTQQPLNSRPAPLGTSRLPVTSSSAVNLTQYAHGAPLQRVTSQPSNEPRRKSQPTVLGGGFLRPLTRVGENSPIGRTHSSATLSGPSQSRSASPILPVPGDGLEAPAMMRRSTDGDGLQMQERERERKRELARRSGTMDTSYRLHGW
ncbi:hypothetical protein P7C73_g4574, partial [Tremellales sp. Uapishka_1]